MQRLNEEWCRRATCSSPAASQFYNELATMLGTGIPIDQALHVIAGYSADETVAVVAEDLQVRVMQGQTLSRAMASFPRIFSKLAVSILRMGEVTGQLTAQLKLLSDWYQREDRLRRNITAALIYPLFTLGVCLFMVVVGPPVLFRGLFTMLKESDVPLPWITQIVIGLSDALLNPLAWILVGASAALAFWLFLRAVKPERRRWLADHWLRHAFLIGSVVQMQALLRFARALAVVTRVGMPIHDGLTLSAACSDSPILESAVAEARKTLMEGTPLWQSLQETGLFPKLFTLTLMASEETGDLNTGLNHLCSLYELELDCKVDVVASSLGPVVTVLVGGLAGTLNLATLLPMMRFLEKL